MALYRQIGGEFQILDTQIQGDRVGQTFDIDPAIAEKAIIEGASMLPEETASQIITEEDWKQHDTAAKLARAKPDFQDKLRAARIAHHELRIKLSSPTSQEPVATPSIDATVTEQQKET